MSTQPPITPEAYAETQAQIVLFASLVADLPLQQFLAAIDRADTLGPVLDPTLWMRGSGKMAQLRRLAVALRGFQAEVEAQQEGA